MKNPYLNFTIAFLFVFLLLAAIPAELTISAQRPIVITADQPNVWTLEQAHYLLAQMHRRNLDLKAKALEDLDANAINGVNIDMVKTLLEASASFDEAKGINNRQLKDQKEFNAERRQLLLRRRSDLEDQSLQLTRQIAELKIKKLQATSDTEKENIQAQIDQLEIVQAAIKEQITQTTTELGTLGAASGDFQSATLPTGGFDKTKFADSLDSLFATTAKSIVDGFNKDTPKLNASLQLDGYLQLEYEILSKQLTLLRDEVGPNERLLFLEMPQSINVSHDKGDKKWAQSWWRIRGYTCESNPADTGRCLGRTEAEREREREQERVRKAENYGTTDKVPEKLGNEHPASIMERIENLLGNDSRPGSGDTLYADEVSGKIKRMIFKDLNLGNRSMVINSPDLQGGVLQNRMIRVVDLFPRQSSLNVNTLKLRSNAFSLKLLFSLITGFGASGNFQRQQEKLSQFVQQELYSSAFGKGSREFGWTFNPMPGTKRLMSGVRTTYAVVVVPKEISELVVESTGCYFERHLEEPYSFDQTAEWSNNGGRSSRGCYAKRAFVIPVPNGGPDNTGFWVDSVFYKPVKKGERIVISIRGQDFSTQTGVLVNGIPLQPALGLAQPFILDDSVTGGKARELLKGEKIRGSYERVGAEQIIASFVMPDDFESTPAITLVAPGKAINLNRLRLRVNSSPSIRLDEAEYMFGTRPPPPLVPAPTDILASKVNVFKDPSAPGYLIATIKGSNLDLVTEVDINGFSCTAAAAAGVCLSRPSPTFPSLIRLKFPAPAEKSIHFTLLNDIVNVAIKLDPVDNPAVARDPAALQLSTNSALLRVEKVEFLEYQERPGGQSVVVVQLTGSGFTDKLKVDKGELIVISPTQAVLQIDKSQLPEVVTLTNEELKIQAKAVIMGKPPA